jgi:large subunit ribosomal protein L10
MKQEKQLLLDEIKQQIEHYGTFVITNYAGVSANNMNQFRNQIASLGGEVQMIRKTVLAKAAEEAGMPLQVEDLKGHIGIVFAGKDPIETTKAVFKFSKENENAITVLGGRFDGRLYKGSEVEMMASLPGKDEMRAQLLGLFVAPLSETLSVMNAIMTSVLYCLENKSQQEASN